MSQPKSCTWHVLRKSERKYLSADIQTVVIIKQLFVTPHSLLLLPLIKNMSDKKLPLWKGRRETVLNGLDTPHRLRPWTLTDFSDNAWQPTVGLVSKSYNFNIHKSIAPGNGRKLACPSRCCIFITVEWVRAGGYCRDIWVMLMHPLPLKTKARR